VTTGSDTGDSGPAWFGLAACISPYSITWQVPNQHLLNGLKQIHHNNNKITIA
jgi:hypothetical protein